MMKTFKDSLLGRVPADGQSIGNTKLQNELKWPEDRFWQVREELINEGLLVRGRGKGGSVRRTPATATTGLPATGGEIQYSSEKSLYPHFHAVLQNEFGKDMGFNAFVFQNTSAGGSKATGGVWTRPDAVLVAVNTYTYLPGKILDIYSFELKRTNDFGILGVYEALAHTRFANRSYYVGHLPGGWEDEKEELLKIKVECERLGIGLLVFSDPKDYKTYEVVVEPKRYVPDPDQQDLFIKQQVEHSTREKLSLLLKV